jgi:hypothetical protein
MFNSPGGVPMKIKYTSCDGTEVEEEIQSAEFYETEICGKPYKQIICNRTPENKYYNSKCALDNSFTVDFDRVKHIKA